VRRGGRGGRRGVPPFPLLLRGGMRGRLALGLAGGPGFLNNAASFSLSFSFTSPPATAPSRALLSLGSLSLFLSFLSSALSPSGLFAEFAVSLRLREELCE